MKYELWLDDIRTPIRRYHDTIVIWCTTVIQLQTVYRLLMDQHTVPVAISLDNDLGKDQPEGFTFLDWLEWVMMTDDPHIYYPDATSIEIHSANPVAQKRMQQTLTSLHNNLRRM